MGVNGGPKEINAQAIAALPDEGPVVMVNLVRYRDRAEYKRYSELTMPLIKQRGGTVLRSTHTLEVAVDLIVHSLSGEQYSMERVEFFLLNFSPSGAKRRITTGLVLSEDDQESLRMYLKARTRFNFWKAHPESHLNLSLD